MLKRTILTTGDMATSGDTTIRGLTVKTLLGRPLNDVRKSLRQKHFMLKELWRHLYQAREYQ